MLNKSNLTLALLILVCGIMLLTHQPIEAASCPNDIAAGAALGIEAVPASADSDYHAAFCKYTKILAPNGQPIEIFAQTQITNEQMVRARRILQFFLEDVPGSQYGADKSAVANQMAINEAKLLLLNGRHDGSNNVDLDGQWLFEEEMPVEGSPAYINDDYENHRDASFEEILHLVHDTGIGVDGEINTWPGILPAYQAEIRAATNNAMANNFQIWPIGADGSEPGTQAWYNEIADENSLTQEYLAAVVDSYYGYWGAYTETPYGMWDAYIAKTRPDVASLDPMGNALMEGFFNPYVTYMARIDSTFDGTFWLTFDAATPYTHKSQYLLNARLTGSNHANLTGNAQNNQLQGNAGNNILDGQSGTDTAIFVGPESEYTITQNGGVITVVDSVPNRDGTDTLHNIENLQFSGQPSTPLPSLEHNCYIPLLQRN